MTQIIKNYFHLLIFTFFNVAIRKFTITYEAYGVFLSDSAGLEQLSLYTGGGIQRERLCTK